MHNDEQICNLNYIWTFILKDAWGACDTYSLETNRSGNGIENGVSVGIVGETSRLDAFEVHGLKREKDIFPSGFFWHAFVAAQGCFTSISFVKRYMDMVVLL